MNPIALPKNSKVETEKTGKKFSLADGSEFDLLQVKKGQEYKLDIDALKKLIDE